MPDENLYYLLNEVNQPVKTTYDDWLKWKFRERPLVSEHGPGWQISLGHVYTKNGKWIHTFFDGVQPKESTGLCVFKTTSVSHTGPRWRKPRIISTAGTWKDAELDLKAQVNLNGGESENQLPAMSIWMEDLHDQPGSQNGSSGRIDSPREDFDLPDMP